MTQRGHPQAAAGLPPLRRVVAGLNPAGAPVFLEDAPAHVHTRPMFPGVRLARVWATGQAPAPIGDPDRSAGLRGIMPLRGGSLLSVLDLPPEPQDPLEREREWGVVKDAIATRLIPPEPGVLRYPDSPLPGLHRTDTIDYAIVLFGEVFAVLENEEKLLKTGDVLIQRGAAHSWRNRSREYCRIAFVLLDAKRC